MFRIIRRTKYQQSNNHYDVFSDELVADIAKGIGIFDEMVIYKGEREVYRETVNEKPEGYGAKPYAIFYPTSCPSRVVVI